jgi:hypothetical protein
MSCFEKFRFDCDERVSENIVRMNFEIWHASGKTKEATIPHPWPGRGPHFIIWPQLE